MAADRSTAESARAVLERKAEIYEKLRRGRTGGLSEAQLEGLLVDVSWVLCFLLLSPGWC
jgi:hypothetical protein